MYQFICVFLFLVFGFPTVLLAQNTNKTLDNLSYDELRNGFFDNEKNKSKQILFAKSFLNKAKKQKRKIQIARAYYLFSLMSEENETISYLDSVIKYSNNEGDKHFPVSAYFEKAYKLKKVFRFKEAINSFMLAEKIAIKNKDDFFFYKVTYAIAVLKSEELGEVTEAMPMYRKCFNYYKKEKIKNPKLSYMFNEVIFALADGYKTLHQNDSSSYFNKMGYQESKISKDDEYKYLFILNEGANLINSKKYQVALDCIHKALPKIIFYKNKGNTLASYYYLGKANEGLGKKYLAVKNFIKVDSMYTINKEIMPEFISGYHYLINHYKATNNKEKQLQYISRLMIIDSMLNKNYKELTKKLQKEYDIPNLIGDNQILIHSLQKHTFRYQWIVGVLGIITTFLIVFGYYQNQLKKSYKIRFDSLIHTKPNLENQIINKKREEKNGITKFKVEQKIGDVILSKILIELEKLETQHLYLKPNITTQSLADEIGTNNKYISTIVNDYKHKKFNDYLNDLRINYALETLKTDSQKRKYTIEALSNEFGFNNAESFSNAFYKRTGIKPSYFIKELEKHINI